MLIFLKVMEENNDRNGYVVSIASKLRVKTGILFVDFLKKQKPVI